MSKKGTGEIFPWLIKYCLKKGLENPEPLPESSHQSAADELEGNSNKKRKAQDALLSLEEDGDALHGIFFDHDFDLQFKSLLEKLGEPLQHSVEHHNDFLKVIESKDFILSESSPVDL